MSVVAPIVNDPNTVAITAKAVVYPAHTVAGYGHIRSLGVAGIHVVALSPANCDNFRSRYVSEAHIVPDPSHSPEAFVEWLRDFGKQQEHKPVLFLAEDLYAYIVSLYQEDLALFFRYPFIAHDKLDVFFNKRTMFEYAQRSGLQLPQTSVNLTRETLQKWELFPALIKPLVSRFTFRDRTLVNVVQFPTIFGGKAVQADDRDALIALYGRATELGIECCVQEVIPGLNRNIANIKFVSGPDHSIPAAFISRKVRQQPPDFGTCCVARAEYIPEIHDAAVSFCRTAAYVGPGGMEFKWCETRKKWYFIEINPRLDFWIGMAMLKGVNLPLQQYFLSTSQPLMCATQQDGGRYWIDVRGDFAGLKWRRGKPLWRLSFPEVLRPYLHFNEAVFNWRDPRPGLGRLLAGRMGRIWRCMKSIARGVDKYLLLTVLSPLVPDSDLGNAVRGYLYRPLLQRCGRNFRVAPGVRILRPERVSVGENVYIGFASYIGEGTVSIGDNVLIGNCVSITPSDHRRSGGSWRYSGHIDRGIIIGKNSWVAAHACLLSGCVIGEGSVVAAGAVVKERTKDNVLVAGIPACEKKHYEDT